MSNVPSDTPSSLPAYIENYRLWFEALSSRLQYAEWAIKYGATEDKIKAQSYLYEYMKASPPQCDDLDIIANDEINAINLQNMDDQLAALEKNRQRYFEIGILLKKIFTQLAPNK